MVYDFKLATMARNLLVWEYEEQSKQITHYFHLMTEIDAADVRILRRAGVVCGGSSGGQEVHELIKNIDRHSTYPSARPCTWSWTGR
jgi:Fe-S cluster assembly ATPase SufC